MGVGVLAMGEVVVTRAFELKSFEFAELISLTEESGIDDTDLPAWLKQKGRLHEGEALLQRDRIGCAVELNQKDIMLAVGCLENHSVEQVHAFAAHAGTGEGLDGGCAVL